MELMFDAPIGRLLAVVLSFVLFVLILYGVLIALLSLERFDRTLHANESVRIIR